MPLGKLGWFSSGLALAVAVLFLGPEPTLAQEPPSEQSPDDPPIMVTTDSPFPLLVDGLPAVGLTTEVLPGSQVCVRYSLRYVSQRERWSFRQWSHGPAEQCVVLSNPGVYRAILDHEFVIHIRSEVGQIRVSSWVLDGERVEVEVPETVQDGERARFRFQEWGVGESPFTAINVIAPLAPMDLEPTWVKEYLVQVEGPANAAVEGSGWHDEGSPLILYTPDVISGSVEGERFKFASWRSVGVPAVAILTTEESSASISVDGPYTIRANYDKEYLVAAQSPFGVLVRKWVKEGEAVLLEAPPIQETVTNQERFVFQRWSGQEGLNSPRITGVANQPINVTAVYARQYMVEVESPYGTSGGGWHTAGTLADISVTEESESKVIFKKSFQSFAGYPKGQSSIEFQVDEPTVVTALYSSKVNAGVLALILLIPLAAVIVFFANRWVMLLVRRPRRAATRSGGLRRLFGRG